MKRLDKYLEELDNLPSRTRAFGLHRRKSVLPTAQQMKSLPLHAKRVPPMDLNFIMKHLLSDSARKRLEHLLRSLHFDPKKHSEKEPTPMKFRIPEAHAKMLAADLNDGCGAVLKLLGHMDKLDISQFQLMRYFCVVEHKELLDRLRPIMWALQFLLASEYESEIKFDGMFEHRQYVHEGDKASAYDLAASFWQVPMPAEAKFVVIDENGLVYLMTRLPYGVDCASEIMQIIMSAVARVAPFVKPGLWRISDGQAKVHVDGALFVTDDEAILKRWRAAIVDTCCRANITLNKEDCNAICSSLRFVGIEYDFVRKLVRIKTSFKLPALGRQMVAAEFESLMGKLIYGGSLLALRFDRFLFAIKFYRRIANILASGRMTRDEIVCVPPSVFAHLTQWYDAVLANEWVPVHQSPWMTPGDVPHAVLITDSTLDGFGAVLLREGHEPLAFGSRWPERRSDVNDAETHAIVLGLRRFEREILDLKNACAGKDRLRLLILVDNTSALHRVIRAGRGVYLRADGYAPAVWDIINAWGIRVRTEYVMSRDNVADAPSRGHVAVDPVLLKATMERAWGQRNTRTQGCARTCVGAAASRRAPTR